MIGWAETILSGSNVRKRFPSKDAVIKYISEAAGNTSQREITKAFNIKKSERGVFKDLLAEIQQEGSWQKDTRREQKKAFHKAEKLKSNATKRLVLPCVVTEVIAPGRYALAPSEASSSINTKILLETTSSTPPLSEGQRLLARLDRVSKTLIRATPIKFFGNNHTSSQLITGVFQAEKNKNYVYPATRKDKQPFYIQTKSIGAAKDGDIVKIEPLTDGRNKQAKIITIFGNIYEPKGLSLISILQNDFDTTFSFSAINEAEIATVPKIDQFHKDLRDYDLVTIDGEDARDFDDAVFAEPTKNGFHVVVAIADVSYYVRPGSSLDKEALSRGNSVYFPDQVLPMLPEKLSNDLCSLRPDQDRACLAVSIYLDEKGHVISHKFVRGLMRSRLRLTYEEAQAIFDGDKQSPLSPMLQTLHKIYALLMIIRQKRGALEIEMPEHQITINKSGEISSIGLRNRLNSHKLIEELMILANVCAAKTLEDKNAPCLFRTHPSPSEAKVLVLKDYLSSITDTSSSSNLKTPHDFNHILSSVSGKPNQTTINEMLLRAQQQALYSTENGGHFGLSLSHYAHFTSPIRRYADLIIHRSLVAALGLGEGGLEKSNLGDLAEIADDISTKERKAERAERDVTDRYLSLYVAESGKLHYEGVITSVRPFGLFIKVIDSGIVGLIPVASMSDFFVYNETRQELHGRSSGTVFKLGDSIKAILEDVDVLTGQINFKLDTKHKITRSKRKKV